jgi:hypothetical protein
VRALSQSKPVVDLMAFALFVPSQCRRIVCRYITALIALKLVKVDTSKQRFRFMVSSSLTETRKSANRPTNLALLPHA